MGESLSEGWSFVVSHKSATRSAIIILSLLLLLGATARAQDAPADQPTVHAAGVVHLAGGTPVPGATVRLLHIASGHAWVSWTDENGKFDLPGLPAGKYHIEVEQLGFDTMTVETEFNSQPEPKPDAKPATPAPFEITVHIAPLVAAAPAQPAANSGQPPAPNSGEPKPAAPGGAATNPNPAANTGTTKPGQPPNGGRTGPNGQRQGQANPNGFRRVDVNGPGAGTPSEGTANAGAADDTGLGEASSSDALLLSGTVGRGDTAGNNMFAIFGGGGPGGGQPGMQNPFGGQNGDASGGQNPFGPGGAGGGNLPGMGPGGPGGGGPGGGGPGGGRGGAGGGPGGGRGGPDGKKPGGQNQNGQNGPRGRQQFGQGAGGLYGAQRVQRQQVNRVRFSFYDRYGNSIFNARPYSLTQANPPKDSYYNTAYGASLGGPLYIPKIYNGKDKTFFFFNYNGARARNPVDTFDTVPTQAERSGDFCATGAQLFNPFSVSGGQRASLGCQIPSNLLSTPSAQAAAGLLQFVPQPNLPGTVLNFHLQTVTPSASDGFNMMVIHRISAKFNLNVRYSFTESRSHSISAFPQLEGNSDSRGQNVQITFGQNYSKSLINSSQIIWSRTRTNGLNNFSFVDNVAGNLGITGIAPSPVDFGIPQISLTNFTGLSLGAPSLTRNQTMRSLDNVTWILTKHTMRFGAELRRLQFNTNSDPTPNGLFSFTGLQTAQLNPTTGAPVTGTGSDLADFLIGLPQSTSIRFGSTANYLRSWQIIGYAQDDWKIHPHFTLLYGIRYEAYTPPVELQGHLADLVTSPDFTQVAVVTPGVTNPFTGQTVPQSLVRGNFKNFSPRLGFAWRPKLPWTDQKHPLVIRAGYSIFYNLSIYTQLARSMLNQPPFATAQTLQTSPSQQLTLINGFPPAPPSTATNTLAIDPAYRPGYAEIWNLSLEQQLTTSMFMELTYTGTKGNHLDMQLAPNNLPPGTVSNTILRGYTFDTDGASSIFHGLQVRLQRRMTKGLMLQGLYTYSKSIDNASSIGGGAAVVVQDFQRPDLDRGLSSFDMRHQFSGQGTYELPFGERKRWARGGWKEAMFGNWNINSSLTYHTGIPYTARIQGFAADNSGAGNSFSVRADQVGNPNTGLGQPLNFFNTAAFVAPPAGQFGDAARGTITGPSAFVVNLGTTKQIRIGKENQKRVDFSWNVSNLFNEVNLTGLSTVVNSTTYGRVIGAAGMRTMTAQIRVNF
jgi:hypothetical protein